MEKQLKPNKSAFMFSRMIFKVILTFVIVVLFYVFLKFIAPQMLVGPFVSLFFIIIISIMYGLDLIVYKKLKFTFYDTKIVQNGGSIFTDYETELNIKNITHVSLKVPFIENKLFNTGHIDIESAGSSASEVHLCAMDNYKEVHSLLVDAMKNNGFKLTRRELVSKERPSALGVFFEVFKSFVVSLFIVFYVISSLLYDEDGNKNELIYDRVMDNLAPLIALGVIFSFIYHIFKFLDLKRRVYKIYKDVITYKEGFLSKNYSLLPFENLTDSGVTQTLIDKIFRLYDVKISCQGSKHEILFKNIENGKGMSDTLDDLIANKENDVVLQKRSGSMSGGGTDHKEIQEAENKDQVSYNRDYIAKFKMDHTKTVKLPMFIFIFSSALAGLSIFLLFFFSSSESMSFGAFLLLSILFFALVSLVSFLNFIIGYIRYRATKFSVEKNSVRYKYNFLSSKDLEFNADKVTGVMITRNFIDEWFNTISVHFWSIGSSSSLVFKNIKKEDEMIGSIVSKFGITKEDKIYTIKPEFNLSEYLKSVLPGFILFALILTVFTVVFIFIHLFLTLGFVFVGGGFFVAYYLYNKEVYKRTGAKFCKHFIYYQKGWLFKKYYYAKYKDIKDIQTTRYPLSSEGKIKFNVAGERIVQSGKNNKRIVSNSFVVDFVENIREKDELIDYIFHKRPGKSEIAGLDTNTDYKNIGVPTTTIKPSVKNTMVPLLIFLAPVNIVFIFVIFAVVSTSEASGLASLIFLALFVFNILLILAFYLPVKMTTYIMDGYRVLSKSGVIFKKQTSIIYDKIDFINNNQRLLNKIFKNGNITVNTVGSSRTELYIKDIPKYLEFYEKLKSKY